MRALLLMSLVMAALGLSRPAGAQRTESFYVVVHLDNPMTSVSRDTLSDIFLKRTTRWSNDDAIHPVDLNPRSLTRREFTADVLRRSVAAVKSYWQQALFSGRDVPPPELESDQDVIIYVSSHPGAIGYVSTDAWLSGVKVIAVE